MSQIEELLGDKAYDTNAVREMLAEMKIEITIPSKSNRKAPVPYDKYSYKGRHLIENLFGDIKHFRGISTRYHELAETFRAGRHLVTWFLRTRRRKGRSSKYLQGRQSGRQRGCCSVPLAPDWVGGIERVGVSCVLGGPVPVGL